MLCRFAGIVLLIALVILVGCSASARYVKPSHVAEKNILFNPEWTGLPSFFVGRTEWPATIAFSHLGEDVEYRETIVDRQGWYRNGRDHLYRRFDSVRIGRIHR